MLEFDLYKIDDKSLGNYAEERVSVELLKRGWNVYRPILDKYIDIIATKKICSNNCVEWDEIKNCCKKCDSENYDLLVRTIQVKGSRKEKNKNSYGIDHEPKDLLHDKGHFFVWVLYDISAKEKFVVWNPTEYVLWKNGNHVRNHTWKAYRGRDHPSLNLHNAELDSFFGFERLIPEPKYNSNTIYDHKF